MMLLFKEKKCGTVQVSFQYVPSKFNILMLAEHFLNVWALSNNSDAWLALVNTAVICLDG